VLRSTLRARILPPARLELDRNPCSSGARTAGVVAGHADRAAIHLAECARLEKQYNIGILLPTVTQWAADLVEAHIRAAR
jgi:hypothetical protein